MGPKSSDMLGEIVESSAHFNNHVSLLIAATACVVVAESI
ncbi:hypothetical protein JCM19239_1143 [Vibrio variabilis]|uniref:Uncharacterized protein n=1 Tax=Vibrio variabilis TaxID=990271 RepID=A0ABQ0JEE5_9VIBR|nr:hypothetical protein JCM19239_1143 [Vibrio variabilis]